MNFAEVRFWELLFGGLAVILLARAICCRIAPSRLELFDKLSLVLLGLFLLLCVGLLTFSIFVAVAVGTYLGLQWVVRQPESTHRFYELLLIPLQLLPLLYFKYAEFLGNTLLGLNISVFTQLIIPVGISFYTFQKVAFVVDTLSHRQPIPTFLDYMNFAGFFPQIVAGPIERRADLLPQMQGFRLRWSADAINEGVRWVVLGLFFKCCLADNLAKYVDGTSISNVYRIWLDNVCFGLRIYYDFAGYSLIALGIARCLGVRLTMNFQSPYCSTSVAEFWRRWHITLSQWFRDYLYFPLGGGRAPWWAFNIALVFTVSGVWHGAGVNFILWGAMHGAFLIVNRLLPKRVEIPAFLGWVTTTFCAFLAWLCFYEVRTSALASKLATIFTPAAYRLSELLAFVRGMGAADLVVIGGFLTLTTIVLLAEWLSVSRGGAPYIYFHHPAVLTLLVLLTLVLAPSNSNGFIYFAF